MQVIATLISLLKGMLKLTLDEYSTLQNSFHQVHEPSWAVCEGSQTVYEHYYV